MLWRKVRATHSIRGSCGPIRQRSNGGSGSKVKKTIGNLPFIEDAIASFYTATDGATPIHVKAVLFGALAYFVLPLDGIPDFLPGIGLTDDAAVLSAAIATVRRHITEEHRRRAREFLQKKLSTKAGVSA